jgi:hypothetical protein
MQGIPAAPRHCAVTECNTILRVDNKDGFCRGHKSATSRAPVRICAADECDLPLRISNKSGFCFRHVQQTPNVLARNESRLAATRERRIARPVCAVDRCTKPLRADNATGRCRDHTYAPEHRPECAYEGCSNRLIAGNETGRCEVHRAKHWVAQRCSATGCDKVLNEGNLSGRCPEHRAYYRRDYMLWRNYRITSEQHDEMLADQHGLCAICGQPPKPEGVRAASRLHVDHDHETGRVRGLLCLNCNRGIGAFGDDANLLRLAADYLDHHAARAA